MSLNWKLDDIPEHQTVCWMKIEDPEEAASIREGGTTGWGMIAQPWHIDADTDEVFVMRGVTNTLIWMMMALGLKGSITKKNVDEAVLQVAIQQRVHGAMLQSGAEEGWEPVYITEADVRAHVGLRTNAFGDGNTKSAFHKSVIATLRETSLKWLNEQATAGENQ